MAEYKICLICKSKFLPSKYRKEQRICSRPECQHQRQLRNLAAWRKSNPGYFKISRHGSSWAQMYRKRAQTWRKRHKDKVRRYKKAHQEEQREYMREYMYRLRHSVGLLLVIAVATLAGCGEGKTPSWLQFGKMQPLDEPRPEVVEQAEGTELASINGRIITLEEFNQRVQARNQEIETTKEIPDSVKSDYLITTSADKEEFLERMVERELIIAEAIQRGLDKDKDILETIEALKEQLLFANIIESERAKASVTTKEIENYYNMYKEVFKVLEERRVSMIVVSSEKKAKEIVINLLQGTDFPTLARENSVDSKSATKGGDIGFIVQKTPLTSPDKKTSFEKLEQAAFSLDLNRPSAIFKGPDGYYIIKVTEIKPAHQRLLSEVYNDIEQGLTLQKQEEALTTLISNLRKKGNIIIHDRLLRE